MIYNAGANDTRGLFVEVPKDVTHSVLAITVLRQAKFARHHGALIVPHGVTEASWAFAQQLSRAASSRGLHRCKGVQPHLLQSIVAGMCVARRYMTTFGLCGAGSGFHTHYSGRRHLPTALRQLIDLIKRCNPYGAIRG